MRLNSISIELDKDDFIWHPHIFAGKCDNREQAKYYGHEWWIIISFWFWSMEILKVAR